MSFLFGLFYFSPTVFVTVRERCKTQTWRYASGHQQWDKTFMVSLKSLKLLILKLFRLCLSHLFTFFPLTQVFSVRYPCHVPFIWELVLQTHFVWSSSLGEQQRQEASRQRRISMCGALSCELHSAHSQTAALPGQNPCEYWHQACNYP